VSEKIAAAKVHKEAGNECFSSSEWRKALAEYHNALLYVKGLGAGSLTGMASMANTALNLPVATTEETTEIKELQKTVNLNMAACQLKLGKGERALDGCNAVLEQEPDNVKALFRRGQAYVLLLNNDRAKKDFERANELQPKTKAVIDELKKIEQWEKAQDKKSQHVYKNMFKAAEAEKKTEPETTGEKKETS